MRDVFVEPAWVNANARNTNIRIVDARSRPHGAAGAVAPSGAEQYAAGHIPEAVHLDYASDLVDPETPYAARVAPAPLFARIVGDQGIGNDTTVVAYDDGDVPYAARLLWMFRYYGHDDVRIMGGGFKAWRAANLPVSTVVPSYPSIDFKTFVRPALRASREEVLSVAQGRSDAQLLETQRDQSYSLRDRGIPRAVRLSGNALLDDANGGRIVPRERLDALIEAAALDRSRRTIVSCGSGVSASGSYLALLEAGFDNVAVYDGSWMEWNHDALPTTPKEMGAR